MPKGIKGSGRAQLPPYLDDLWPELGYADCKVLGALAILMGGKCGWKGPMNELRAKAGISNATMARRAVCSLERIGLLAVDRSAGDSYAFYWAYDYDHSVVTPGEPPSGHPHPDHPVVTPDEAVDPPVSPPTTPLLNPLKPSACVPCGTPIDSPSKETSRDTDKKKRLTIGQEFLNFYHAEFQKVTGYPYAPSWGKEMKLISPYLKVHPVELLKELAAEFLKNPPEWVAERGLDVALFCCQINKQISRGLVENEGTSQSAWEQYQKDHGIAAEKK